MRGKPRIKETIKNMGIQMKKGITLVALIVTIIVLLILATVTIGLIIGDRSVIWKARESTDKTKLNEIVDRMNNVSSNIFMEVHSGLLLESDRSNYNTIRDKVIEFNSEDAHLMTSTNFRKNATSNIYTFVYQAPNTVWELTYVLNLETYNNSHIIVERP